MRNAVKFWSVTNRRHEDRRKKLSITCTTSTIPYRRTARKATPHGS